MNVLNQLIDSKYALYMGDCVETLRGIPDGSIHYSIFSPPFASLYTYSNSDRDMGNSRDDGEFQQHFAYLISELLRIIMPGRLVSIHCMNLPAMKSRDGFIGVKDFRGDIIRAFTDAGFIFHSEVCIWKNPVTEMQRTKALADLLQVFKASGTGGVEFAVAVNLCLALLRHFLIFIGVQDFALQQIERSEFVSGDKLFFFVFHCRALLQSSV